MIMYALVEYELFSRPGLGYPKLPFLLHGSVYYVLSSMYIESASRVAVKSMERQKSKMGMIHFVDQLEPPKQTAGLIQCTTTLGHGGSMLLQDNSIQTSCSSIALPSVLRSRYKIRPT